MVTCPSHANQRYRARGASLQDVGDGARRQRYKDDALKLHYRGALFNSDLPFYLICVRDRLIPKWYLWRRPLLDGGQRTVPDTSLRVDVVSERIRRRRIENITLFSSGDTALTREQHDDHTYCSRPKWHAISAAIQSTPTPNIINFVPLCLLTSDLTATPATNPDIQLGVRTDTAAYEYPQAGRCPPRMASQGHDKTLELHTSATFTRGLYDTSRDSASKRGRIIQSPGPSACFLSTFSIS
ncbi:hypothetical protein AB1N83_009848 [Pleurotus pulmonarius]